MSTLKLSRIFRHREPRRSPTRESVYDSNTVKAVWADLDVEKMVCHKCGQPVTYDHVLARTFKLADKNLPIIKQAQSEIIEVPSLSETILVFNRHLDCLQASTPYVAVSHVWHGEVAELQYKHTAPAEHVSGAAMHILETPTRLCKALALAASSKGARNIEVWHDYLSVPQWQPQIKRAIIERIPRIFSCASFVLLHLSDIDISSFQMMRNGSDAREIARGISNICNAEYFSRVWTAMEYTQAIRAVRVIVKDYTWIEPHVRYPFLIDELHMTWNPVAEKAGNPKEVEKWVGMGYNLVPWQIGPLHVLRNLNERAEKQKATRPMFAQAYDLLSRRSVTLERDFFHALIGTLKLDDVLTEADLSPNNEIALMQVARHCILDGDLSPLFQIPVSAQNSLSDNVLQRYGYTDMLTWGLGHELSRPSHTEGIWVSETNNLVRLKAENLGTVTSVRRELWSIWNDWGVFHSLLKIALESLDDLGNIDEFVNTLCARLYGLSPRLVQQRLSADPTRLPELKQNLIAIYNSYPKCHRHLEEPVADALGLSNTTIRPDVSPMASLSSYAGSIHLGAAVALVYVTCPMCTRAFPIRVALLKPASIVLSGPTRAYRIPGLQYFAITNADGGGFLLDADDRIVGRFVWGTPTCHCDGKLQEVSVRLEGVPLPMSNAFKYGSMGRMSGQWLPLQQEARIRF